MSSRSVRSQPEAALRRTAFERTYGNRFFKETSDRKAVVPLLDTNWFDQVLEPDLAITRYDNYIFCHSRLLNVGPKTFYQFLG